MPLSRFRLRLAAWFALAFLTGLTVLDLALYAYLRHQSSQRMTRALRETAGDLARAIQFEYHEQPTKGLGDAVREALTEWQRPGTFVVYADDGHQIMFRGDGTQLRHMPVIVSAADTGIVEVTGSGALHFRQATVASREAPRFFVRASGSTKAIHDESAALLGWLVFTPPVVLLLSFIVGYILSRRALTPIEALGRQVAAIAPEELDRRLPIGQAPDEIDQLAMQFNGLLERLQRAGQQNRRFVQQAAHQIRTPLTLVLGEAGLSLDRPRTPDEQSQTLERIRTAAIQMKRRVDELLLLAQADAGERPQMDETVELDGVILECADLMRARAQGLGQHLELLRAEPISANGNEALLKEAVLELIENACRYGSAEHPISLSAFQNERAACMQVVSWGTPPSSIGMDVVGTAANDDPRRGLGLTIVRWIASEHRGTLTYLREGERNIYQLSLPAIANNSSPS